MANFYYAVRKGHKPGVYSTWKQCEENVKGFSGAEYKKFKTLDEALSFIDGDTSKEYIVEEENIKNNEAIAYVDGSFNLDKFIYSYGVVFITSEGMEEYNGKDGNKELAEMRNVAGEIRAAMEAMNIAIEKNKDILYLHYDYAGIEKWAKGDWKTNKEGTKAYKEFYDSIKDKLKVEFIKVKAHSGIKYNELADKLAKEAIT